LSTAPACPTCGKIDLPDQEIAPKEKREEYCDCVKWTTMDQCVGLACRNAKELVGDAELLFKAGRLETATALITFAKEEEGKAVMAAQWWLQRKNLTRDEYFERFRARDSHLQKLVEATRIHYTQSMPDWWRKRTAEDELNRRERALYTDYDFELRQWALPRLEFMAQLNPEIALEGEKHFEKFDSLVIQQDIKGIRMRVDWFLGQFQKRKSEHIPGAVVVLPDRKPTLLPVSKQFTLSFLQEMETALVDKRDELRNTIADTRYAKWPSFLSTSLIDSYRKYIQDEKLPENKRILTKLLVDELRRGTFGDFLTVLHFTERKWEYLGAMKLMNDFAGRFGIPFCRQHRYPSIVKRPLNRISERRGRPPFDVVQQWRDSYRECFDVIRTDNPSRDALKKYWKLETDFKNLFTYSDWSLVL
jgi:AbiV family abortive infection protein